MVSFDGFWKKVRLMIYRIQDPDKQKRPKVTVGWGNAKFKAHGRLQAGSNPGMSRRVRATMSEFF
jgi:hypothetical protein